MVSVDTVYQKVLALANKEQRGYITPQDFNLFANQAQMEIFEQYFYDTNIARKSQGNDTVYADVDDMLEEKLQIFETVDTASTTPSIPSYYPNVHGDMYRIHELNFKGRKAEILNTKDFNSCQNGGPLLRPTKTRLVANIRNNKISMVGSNNVSITPTEIYYFRAPQKVNWTYVVINKNAMYDANPSTQDFELHSSEENQLVNKILTLAGLANQQPDVMKAGQGMDMATKQQQPKI
jgi:hypothetical protein